MYNSKPAEGDLPTSRQLGRTTAIAAGIAIILLVGVVMPSEYGIDPTGVGRVLGLKEMGRSRNSLPRKRQLTLRWTQRPPKTRQPPC
jgi:hypothetical protein